MCDDYMWREGKSYKTKGILIATITRIRERSVPKDLALKDLEKLLSKPHFGIEGYVRAPKDTSKRKYKTTWTMEGKHSLHSESSDVGDLTTEEANEPD